MSCNPCDWCHEKCKCDDCNYTTAMVALQDIKKHQKYIIGNLGELTTTYRIAKEALEKIPHGN